MNNLFECKAKYQKIDEDGQLRVVREYYLVDAVSHGDAEERMHKEMESMISGDFEVTNVKNVNYTEVFQDNSYEKWFKAKVQMISIDEKSGKGKKVTNTIVATATDVKHAFDNITEGYKDLIVPYTIVSITESPILDFFEYNLEAASNEM